MNPPKAHYVTCRCQSCDGHIEFDANQLVKENSVIPCPHCGLETKLFILQKVTVPAGALPPQVKSPPARTSENFTEEQINSVGQRQNDPMANRLYGEGDQDMPVKLEDARRYVRDPRIKMMNPETGERFTPQTLEAFIRAKQKSQTESACNVGENSSPKLVQTIVGDQIKTSHYIIIELQQGTTEWLEWRHNGIGASDASTIMGENRFKTAAQLLQEKCGPARDYGQNAAMARGTELEPEARRLYRQKTGKEVRPACLQSTRYNWLRASLDGFAVNNDGVVEIKCGQSAYRTASQTRAVPNYYYGQVQHILAVTGLDSLDFWCYWPGCSPLLIPVARNNGYIERLLKRELEFWNLVQRQ